MFMKNLKKIVFFFTVIIIALRNVEAQYAVRPINSGAYYDSSVIVNCSAQDDNENVIWFEYLTNDDGIHISYNQDIRHPNGVAKYEILGKYNLLIKDIQTDDAGTYSCQLVGAGTQSYMELFVATYQYSRCREDFIENQWAELCYLSIDFNGRWSGAIGKVEGLADRDGLDIQVSSSTVHIYLHTYLEPSVPHHKNQYICSLEFAPPGSSDLPEDSDYKYYDRSAPNLVTNCTEKIDLEYLVRDICIKPNLAVNNELDVGEEITCDASGNPEPHVRWNNVIGPETSVGGVLPITPEMIGTNTYECVAHNTVDSYQKSVKQEVQFVAKNNSNTSSFETDVRSDSCTPNVSESEKSGLGDAAIIVLIIVCIVGLVYTIGIICAIVLFQRRSKRNIKEDQYSTPDAPSNIYCTPDAPSNIYCTPDEPSDIYCTPDEPSNIYSDPEPKTDSDINACSSKL